jgi:hypothetical protein
MHIYITGRHLNPPGPGEDRLIKIGRHWVRKGHKVIVFLSADRMNLNLKEKKIGLTEQGGLVLVAFNTPEMLQDDQRNRKKGNRKFASLLNRQGKMLPEPDLILAVAPPLSTALAAEELSSELKVPLILEIRAGLDKKEARRGFLAGLFARSRLRKEEKLLDAAEVIAVEGKAVAARIEGQLTEKEKKKVNVIKGQESEEELKAFYDCLLPEGENK